MDPNARIAIIGGSLVGPVTALLLQKAGFTNVHVYEAAQQAAPQGGGVISLDDNSLEVIDSFYIPRKRYIPLTNRAVQFISVADRIIGERNYTHYDGQHVAWFSIHRALRQEIPPDNWHANKELIDLNTNNVDNQVQLEFSDKTQTTADLVIFADGRKSTGRKILEPNRLLRYAGYVSYRGQLPSPLIENGDLCFYKLPNSQFLHLPFVRDGQTFLDWTFYLKTDPEKYQQLFGGKPTELPFVLPNQFSPDAWEQVLQAATELLPNSLEEIVRQTPKPGRTAVSNLDITEPQQMFWHLDGAYVVLLGDALAPIRAHATQGANNGIAQAKDLAQNLSGEEPLSEVLNSVQSRQLPRVRQTLEEARERARELGLEPATPPPPAPPWSPNLGAHSPYLYRNQPPDRRDIQR